MRAAPAFPPLAGRVTDAANVLPADVRAALDAKLAALEAATGTQLVVATVPSLQDLPIDDYGYQLGRAWGIGQKGQNNGVILLVAPTERKVRIEIGYGLEGVLTDALSATIIRDAIVPRVKAGDLPGGIVAGADALIAQLQLPPDAARAQAAAAAAQTRERRGGDSGGSGLGALFWLAIVVIWLFASVFRRRRGTSSGIGNAILWGVASSMFNNRGGGGWGGGGGGGGGFSGGGGSFGGGGASGGW